MALLTAPSISVASTADHSKFDQLNGPFSTAESVTKACLSCHTKSSAQVMDSLHWTWDTTHPVTGQALGKKRIINSFCGSPLSNEPRCTSCHAGYGWTDLRDSAPTDPTKVDCLVCHDTSGAYEKIPTDAGYPQLAPRMIGGKLVQPPDLSKIARSVGKSGRENCGACHFNGGGGDGVKHGDLDTSLINPPLDLDVHMSADGENMSCSQCHTFNDHIPSGSRYRTTAVDTHGLDLPHDDHDRATCESCHGGTPHQDAKLDDHTDRVACQTCHIPEFARGGVATKTWWDWSTGGRKDADGKPLYIKDEHGHLSYSAQKGDFKYEENVRPAYLWYNGLIEQTAVTDKLDSHMTDGILILNRIEGSATDGKSRIWPFKEMRGKQPYDPVNNTLVVNHVFGDDDSAFWTNFDYPKAIAYGMAYAGLPWSGTLDFIETRMYWPITHMVAPKEQALRCGACHTTDPGGRMATLSGFYLPGRDHALLLDILGYLMLGGSLVGVFLHGAVRILLRKRPSP